MAAGPPPPTLPLQGSWWLQGPTCLVCAPPTFTPQLSEPHWPPSFPKARYRTGHKCPGRCPPQTQTGCRRHEAGGAREGRCRNSRLWLRGWGGHPTAPRPRSGSGPVIHLSCKHKSPRCGRQMEEELVPASLSAKSVPSYKDFSPRN